MYQYAGLLAGQRAGQYAAQLFDFSLRLHLFDSKPTNVCCTSLSIHKVAYAALPIICILSHLSRPSLVDQDVSRSVQDYRVDSVDVFYREAGSATLPTLLLLHGHASASHTFSDIIVPLSGSFHVIAPDYPGFGNSSRPAPKDYAYTFVNLANTIDKFTEQLGLAKYSLYLFDFGAPVGLLMASKHPERVTGLFSQSGNAYDEGLSPAFEMIRAFWADPQDATKIDGVKHIFTPEGIPGAYQVGVPRPELVDPDGATLDTYYTSRPGAIDIQVALLRDYENNVQAYSEWQAYLRKHKPKVVAVWGKHDPFFSPPGAESFKKDVENADVSIIDAGHFVMKTHPEETFAV